MYGACGVYVLVAIVVLAERNHGTPVGPDCLPATLSVPKRLR